MKNPEYIQIMFAGVPERLIYSEESVFCNRCNAYQYVSDQEMWFLKENHHIINSQVNTAHLPKIRASDIENPDRKSSPVITFEYAYVSRFCPHCERKEFGDLSNWRE